MGGNFLFQGYALLRNFYLYSLWLRASGLLFCLLPSFLCIARRLVIDPIWMVALRVHIILFQ